MFTFALAKARKNAAETPGCERMPAPISETLAISSSNSTRSNAIDGLSDSIVLTANSLSVFGHVKVISVEAEAAVVTFCTIMSMFICADAIASKIVAALPGLSGTPTIVILASDRSCATPEIIGCSTFRSLIAVCDKTQVPS